MKLTPSLAAALFLIATPAAAKPPGEPGEGGRKDKHEKHEKHEKHGKHGKRGEGVCEADRDRLCKEAGGKQATETCMESHKAELTPACRERLEKALGLKNDCKADTEKYCSEVPAGGGRLVACLVGRKADLAPTCRPHIDAAIAKFKERGERRDEKKGEKAPK